MRAQVLSPLLLLLTGCVDTTGGELFTFQAFARGPEAASHGHYRFTNGYDYAVELSHARLQVGAIYLDRAVPNINPTGCVLSGIYDAQVTRGLRIDALSSERQPFPGLGEAISGPAVTAELWLACSGADCAFDINDPNDATVILDVAGTATAATSSVGIPFAGQLTIGQNRSVPIANPAMPGSNPICKQRIVSPIPSALDLTRGGALELVINPAAWFGNVDFSRLRRDPDDPARFRFGDQSLNQPDKNLYLGLKAGAGQASSDRAYNFNWTAP